MNLFEARAAEVLANVCDVFVAVGTKIEIGIEKDRARKEMYVSNNEQLFSYCLEKTMIRVRFRISSSF
jgi:hypothetical protein